jgi:hypothetical protein
MPTTISATLALPPYWKVLGPHHDSQAGQSMNCAASAQESG